MTEVTLKFFDLFPSFEEELRKNFKDQTEFKLSDSSKLKVEMITCNIFDLPEFQEPEKHPQVAFVSPANSFGWMSGGIDAPLAKKVLPGIEKTLQKMLTQLNYRGDLEKGYSKAFLDKMLDSIRTIFQVDLNLNKKVVSLLQKEGHHVDDGNFDQLITPEFIKKYFPRRTPDHHLPVGSALLVHHPEKDQFLVSAPTMFFPQDVRGTRNAYFAMVGILKVVQKYNLANPNQPIKTILCPGLCTGVGGLSFQILAQQVYQAVLDFQKGIQDPDTLDQELVKSFEDQFPNQLYLRESAYHQAPLKMGMMTYGLKSMLTNDDSGLQLLEGQFEGTAL